MRTGRRTLQYHYLFTLWHFRMTNTIKCNEKPMAHNRGYRYKRQQSFLAHSLKPNTRTYKYGQLRKAV
jgi:hypothetical protein